MSIRIITTEINVVDQDNDFNDNSLENFEYFHGNFTGKMLKYFVFNIITRSL